MQTGKSWGLQAAAWLGLLGLIGLIGLRPALAQGRQVSDDEVNAVAKQLYCPVCQSEPLDVCGTQACRDWREEIRTQLSNGATEQQVIDYFVQRYGDRVRAEPRFSGAGLVVWLAPLFALIVAGWLFVRFLQRMQTPPSAPKPADTPALTPGAGNEYARRVEDELKDK